MTTVKTTTILDNQGVEQTMVQTENEQEGTWSISVCPTWVLELPFSSELSRNVKKFIL